MCALKTPKRLGLTGTPLENDYDEVQTLLKWLDIKSWNDRKVFNEYFVSKRPKESKARTLKEQRNAILSTSLRACVFPLRIDDTFDGKQLVEFSRAIENHTPVTLSPEESVRQKDTKQLWDRKEGARGKASEKMMRERALPKILKARMKTVHLRCGEFMYGDQGAQDYSGLGLDLEEWESLTKKEAYIDMTVKESRKQLLKETEKDWHSTRVDKLIEQILSLHESKSEGKIIITDEFLQTLDVVSNALKATGFEFLEFNGHMSLKERDAVRERFNDPKDKVRVMLATIQCFDLGLTLVEATNMFILTPRWNPAIDAQAALRINRISQNRQVTVWTFYAHNSIECYVEKERERKKKKAVLTLDQKEAIARVNRIAQNSEVTVWTYESPNSIEAYVMKTRKKKKKKKKKKKAKLTLH